MPIYEHQNDKSMENPQPIVGVEALAKLTPPQGDAMLLRLVGELAGRLAQLDNRLKYLEKYETNSHPPVRTVTGDAEFIKVTQSEEHVLIGFDEEELRRHFPPPLYPTYLDKYRHCTDPTTYPDIYIPSGVADANINADGTLVMQFTFADNGVQCYYIIERNVLGAPTPYAAILKIDDCTDCEPYTPPTPEPDPDPDPDGDYSYFDGWVMANMDCALDAAGDLIITVKFVNIFTGEIKFEQRLNCCCDTPPVSVPMDRWRPCDAMESGDNSQDIFLLPAIFEWADAPDPVIQVGESGCCYRFVEATADETLTDTDIWLKDTCADEDCDACPPPITYPCTDCTGTQPVPVLVNTDPGDTATSSYIAGTFVYDGYFDAGGGNCYWQWTSDLFQGTGYHRLFVYQEGTVLKSRIGFTASSTVYAGDFSGAALPGNYKDISGTCTCVNGVMTGTFVIESVSPGGGTNTPIQITIG